MGIHYKKKARKDSEDDSLQELETNTYDEEAKLNLEVPIDDPNHVLHKEMFLENYSELRDVSIQQQFIDFNYCEYGKFSEGQSITIKNKLPYRIELKWVLPSATNSQGEQVKNPYSLSEMRAIIEPNSTYDFDVKFKPFEPDYYFFQILQ